MRQRHASKTTKPWMTVVAQQAAYEWAGAPLLEGAVWIEVICFEPRPKSHFRTGKYAHLLRPDAPAYPHITKTGDSDKLRRSTSGWWSRSIHPTRRHCSPHRFATKGGSRGYGLGSPKTSMTTDDVAGLIRQFRFRYLDEDQLQEGLAGALEPLGEVRREVRIASGRLDLLIERIGVEVKIAGPTKALERQITRYLKTDAIDGIVVVAMSPRHANLPREIEGKPVEVVVIAGDGL